MSNFNNNRTLRILEQIVRRQVREIMREAKTKLLATSATEEGIKKLISEYFYGSTISLTPISDTEFEVHNKKGKLNNYRVILKGGKYRFEEL